MPACKMLFAGFIAYALVLVQWGIATVANNDSVTSVMIVTIIVTFIAMVACYIAAGVMARNEFKKNQIS